VMGQEPRWTFKEDSVPALRKALLELVDQPISRPIALSQAQQQLASQVDPEQAASKVVSFWHRAMALNLHARRR